MVYSLYHEKLTTPEKAVAHLEDGGLLIDGVAHPDFREDLLRLSLIHI